MLVNILSFMGIMKVMSGRTASSLKPIRRVISKRIVIHIQCMRVVAHRKLNVVQFYQLTVP